MQAPHLEDEVYLVLEGKARLRVADKDQEVRQGSILYVQATAEHSFFDIEEDPAEKVDLAASRPEIFKELRERSVALGEQYRKR